MKSNVYRWGTPDLNSETGVEILKMNEIFFLLSLF